MKLNTLNSILLKLESLLCIPIESTCDAEQWLSDPNLLFYNRSDPDYKKACNAFLRKIQFFDIDQIYSLHSLTEKPIYAERSTKHYYTVEESLHHVEILLEHQYPGEVHLFIKRLYEICEKVKPKKNCMYIVGAPNSGKTWFFDSVIAFYLNVGYVKNFTKHCSFPLNDCVSRRILMWNEPSISQSQYETIKMLTGGDPCSCAVKYEGDGKITRTPLLITANSSHFNQSDPVWSTRIYFERWSKCSYLSTLEFYPHPLTYYHLVKKYIDQ